VIGKDFVELYITEAYRSSVKEVLDNALDGIDTVNFEFPLFGKDGERYFNPTLTLFGPCLDPVSMKESTFSPTTCPYMVINPTTLDSTPVGSIFCSTPQRGSTPKERWLE